MSKFLIYNIGIKGENQKQFDDLNAKINSLEGYPNGFGTLKYADPIPNNDGVSIAIEILPGVEKYLNLQDFGKLVDKLDSTWFIDGMSSDEKKDEK